MLVALINPPWLQDGRVGIRAGSRWSYTVESLGRDATIPFPFFLAQTASLLESHGFDITLMDGVAEKAELDPYLDRVVQADPQLIVYETSTPSFRYDCDIAGRLRDRLPTARIAFAGPHVTVFPAETLREQQAIDFILVGEYEATALALAEALREGRPPDGLPGLCLLRLSALVIVFNHVDTDPRIVSERGPCKRDTQQTDNYNYKTLSHRNLPYSKANAHVPCPGCETRVSFYFKRPVDCASLCCRPGSLQSVYQALFKPSTLECHHLRA